MNKIFITFLITFFMIWPALSVFACECPEPPPPLKALYQAKIVFVGRVIKGEITKYGSGEIRKYTFTRLEVVKGKSSPEIEIYTGVNEEACGYDFGIGKTYLVYAQEYNKIFISGACSRTKEFQLNRREDIEELDKIQNP